jgi:nickel transport protein
MDGKTNEQGEFSFKVPQKTTMRIVVKAGMGHQGEAMIPLEDIEAVSDGVIEPVPVQQESEVSAGNLEKREQSAMVTSITAEDIQMAVEKALDAKLKPIMKKLAASKDTGPSVNDIFGGIGYIFGLVGVGAYFNYRRKKD